MGIYTEQTDSFSKSLFGKKIKENCTLVERVKFKKGDVILAQGKPAINAFFHLSGTIKIVSNYETDQPTIISFMKAEGFIGLPSVVLRKTYLVSAIALDDVEGCFVSSSELKELTSDSESGFDIVKKIATDVLLLQERIISMTAKNSSERLLNAVDYLKSTYGIDEEGRINLRITIKELAELVCISRETMHRILKELEIKKKLIIKDKYLYLLNNSNGLS